MLRGQRVGLRYVTEDDLPWLKRTTGDPLVRGPHLGARMMTPHAVDQRWKDNGFANEDAERLLICHLIDGSVIGDVVHFAAARYTTAREIGWTLPTSRCAARAWPARRPRCWWTTCSRTGR